VACIHTHYGVGRLSSLSSRACGQPEARQPQIRGGPGCCTFAHEMNGVCATDSEVSNPSFTEPRKIATRLVMESIDGVGAIGAARHTVSRIGLDTIQLVIATL
jgi:hypothetical protein